MNKKLAAQLKDLKNEHAGGNPDASWLASTRETLMMQVSNTVSQTQPEISKPRAFAEFAKLFRPLNMTRALATPLAVLLLMVGASVGASALVSSSDATLPGDTLYGVKLLSERASLTLARGTNKTEKHLMIAGRRLSEMAKLDSGSDYMKDENIASVAGMFSVHMNEIRNALSDAKNSNDEEAAVLLALKVDAKADEYHELFSSITVTDAPAARLALLSLDQVSIKALELLIEKQNLASGSLPEAQLSANVEASINTFASRVASTEKSLGGDASIADSRILLTERARTAVDEAKELFSQGDFKAAVRKVIEGTDLVTEAETATDEAPIEEEASEGSELVEGEEGSSVDSGENNTSPSSDSGSSPSEAEGSQE